MRGARRRLHGGARRPPARNRGRGNRRDRGARARAAGSAAGRAGLQRIGAGGRLPRGGALLHAHGADTVCHQNADGHRSGFLPPSERQTGSVGQTIGFCRRSRRCALRRRDRMLNQMLRKLIAVGLLVICPSTLLMAERPSAMLSATGAVTLNGTPTAKSTSLFDGDRVATADASVVSINQNGSSLVVDPNSSVRYRNDALT